MADGICEPAEVLCTRSSLRMVFIYRQATIVGSILIYNYGRIRSIRIASTVGRIRRAKLTVVVPDALTGVGASVVPIRIEHRIGCVFVAVQAPEVCLVIQSAKNHQFIRILRG